MIFSPLKTRLFRSKENLFSFFAEAISDQSVSLSENTVIILASKIVALAQGRVVSAGKKEMEEWVRKESEKYWETKYPGFFLSLKDGMLIANAGIDLSNAGEGTFILWPENPQIFADDFRKNIQKKWGLKNIGVLIADSRCTPLRAGITGLALAWSGFEGVRNEIGKKDLFGKELEVTKNAIADNLASAAQLLLGSSDERTPFVICENAPVDFTDLPQNPDMAIFPAEEDLFSVFWNSPENIND